MTELILTRDDAGGQFWVQPADSILIQLPENPTTGYLWATDPTDEAIVAPEGSTFAPAGSGAGAGGTRTMCYVATGAGTVDIRLKLWRAWEGENSVIDRFGATITVQP